MKGSGEATSGWVVIQPVANLYSTPSDSADVVTQAIYATVVEVIQEQPGWLRIMTPDHYQGWAPRPALHPLETAYPGGETSVRVASLFANLYAEPDVTKHRPLLTIPFEAMLEVAAEPPEQQARWIRLRLPDDRTAWVQRGDVTSDGKPLPIVETIRLAKRFLGLPYLWGGTSTFGYDCSGFTQMLCRRRGFGIPRDAGPQAAWNGMLPLAREELEPGDLIFFGSSAEKITHTGMYIGGGEFIHATTHLRPVVQISRLDEPHWDALLVACRRLKIQEKP